MIRLWREQQGHLLLHEALEVAEALVEHLRRAPGIARAGVAGDLRRRHERVSSLDVVVASGLAVRRAWTRPEAYGTALVKHTGSPAHWRRLGEVGRELASPVVREVRPA